MPEFLRQQRDIATAYSPHERGIAGPRITRGVEKFGDNLRVGLAVEAHLFEQVGGIEFFGERRRDGAPARTGRQEEGAIDIEKHECIQRHHRKPSAVRGKLGIRGNER